MINRETTPDPARFAALKRAWAVECHDNWPDHYELCGSIPGEGDWEWVEKDNVGHMQLRSAAIERVPQMLVELQETYDLLLDMNDRGEIDGPDWIGNDGTLDRTGRRLWTLMQCIGMTLEEIDQRGVELGLQKQPASTPAAQLAQRNQEPTHE